MFLPEDIHDIILSQPFGELEQSDFDRLKAWIAESPENRRTYEDFVRLRRSMKWSADWDAVDDSVAWEKILGRHHTGKRRRSLRRVSVAASVALVVGVAAWMLFPQTDVHGGKPEWVPNEITLLTTSGAITLSEGKAIEIDEDGAKISADTHSIAYDTAGDDGAPVVYNTLLIPRGMQHTLRLSDGSTIVLNSETKIKYPVYFSGEVREVFLDGEAYFDIKKNPDKPFIVHSKNADTEVLGTEFNFSAYGDEPATTVTLIEGSVKVGRSGATEILTPGKQYSVSNSTLEHTVKDVDTTTQTSWMTGVFSFEAMPLEQLMNRLSKWFDIEYEFRDDALRANRYTGGISRDGDVEQVLRVLGEVYNVSFKARGNRIVISAK